MAQINEKEMVLNKEVDFLTDKELIREAKIYVKYLEFSIYYREHNVKNTVLNKKDYKKVLGYLKNHENKEEQKRQTFPFLINMIENEIEKAINNIEKGKEIQTKEIKAYETIKEHIFYDEKTKQELFDKNFFTPLLLAARLEGLTDISLDLRNLMIQTGFMKDAEIGELLKKDETPKEKVSE
jgi:hypothetical protein